jgi:biopolymer transport protein ExbB/TolQ
MTQKDFRSLATARGEGEAFARSLRKGKASVGDLCKHLVRLKDVLQASCNAQERARAELQLRIYQRLAEQRQRETNPYRLDLSLQKLTRKEETK